MAMSTYVYTYVYIFLFDLSIHHLPGFRIIICPFLYFFVCRSFSMFIHVMYTQLYMSLSMSAVSPYAISIFSKYISPLPLFHCSAIYFFVICYSVFNGLFISLCVYVSKYPYVRYIKTLFYALYCLFPEYNSVRKYLLL
jgi:hypothetical protein